MASTRIEKISLFFQDLRKQKFYVVAIVLGLFIGSLLILTTMRNKDAEMRVAVVQNVHSIEQALDLRVVEQTAFVQFTTDSPAWQQLIAKLEGVCHITPNCKWIYLTYLDKHDNVRQIASTSNELTSPVYAPPNTIYAESTAENKLHFKTHHDLIEGPTPDQWGVWVTACVMHEARNVDGYYPSVCMDVDAKNWYGLVHQSALYPLLFTLAYLVLIGYMLIKNLAEINKNRRLQDEAGQLYLKASRDHLTGLANRALFEDRLLQTDHAATRTSSTYAILFMDLDGFKAVNDSYGHKIGDEVLKTVASRISVIVRAEDTLARFGGDEFVLLLSNVLDKQGTSEIAERIIQLLQMPVVIQGVAHKLGISIGVAIALDDAVSPPQLLKMADEAMYYSKKHGKNQFKHYSDLPESNASN